MAKSFTAKNGCTFLENGQGDIKVIRPDGKFLWVPYADIKEYVAEQVREHLIDELHGSNIDEVLGIG